MTAENKKDIIFIKSSDGNSTFLDYIDLTTPYNIAKIMDGSRTVDEESYKNSLWCYLGKTGYYYTYHKQNELITSYTPSKQYVINGELKVRKEEFWTYEIANVVLYSPNSNKDSGKIISFTGDTKTITDTGIEYDFVDTVLGRNGGEPLSYDDIILENGTVLTFDEETLTYPESIVERTFMSYDEAYAAKNSLPDMIIRVMCDKKYNNETTFYQIVDSTMKYFGKEKHGYLYYYNKDTDTITPLEAGTDYEITQGITGLTFLWKHYPTEDYIIDPCSSNIIDMYVLTNTYYNEVQEWVANGKVGTFPKAPSAYELKSLFVELENNKMISDTMVWHPVNYKLIFGQTADTDTHCIFKVIKTDDLLSDNEVKKSVIQLIDNYFKTMEAGETFYFTQLSTYIELNLSDMIKTCVIVPTDTSNKFGNLFQIKCSDNEILLSSATLDDVQIISTITKENIRATS